MGRSFWAVYLYVLMPGVWFVGLVAIFDLRVNILLVMAIQVLASIGLLAVVVWRRGWDSLGETRGEILDQIEEEEESRPLPIRPGEFSSEQLVAKFDRGDGNRPDSPVVGRE